MEDWSLITQYKILFVTLCRTFYDATTITPKSLPSQHYYKRLSFCKLCRICYCHIEPTHGYIIFLTANSQASVVNSQTEIVYSLKLTRKVVNGVIQMSYTNYTYQLTLGRQVDFSKFLKVLVHQIHLSLDRDIFNVRLCEIFKIIVIKE